MVAVKKRTMGEAATSLFQKTGADALAAVTGAPEKAKAARPAARPSSSKEAEYAVTTVRLTRDQWATLRRAAMERSLERGGKPDSSEILRDVLDEWIAKKQRT